MNTDLLITGISQLATPVGAGPKFGAQMREVSVIENAAMSAQNRDQLPDTWN